MVEMLLLQSPGSGQSSGEECVGPWPIQTPVAVSDISSAKPSGCTEQMSNAGLIHKLDVRGRVSLQNKSSIESAGRIGSWVQCGTLA